MPKLIWEKKLQEAVKRQQRFGWSVHSGQRKRYLKSIIKDKKELIFLVLKRWLMSMLNFQII